MVKEDRKKSLRKIKNNFVLVAPVTAAEAERLSKETFSTFITV